MPGEWLAQRLGTCWMLALALGAGCARPVVAPAPAATSDRCLVAPPPAAAAESLSVAYAVRSTSGVGDPDLLDASRVVNALAYEPLVRVDCAGAIVAALAERWDVDRNGRRWTFTIRSDAAWPDGRPIASRDVIAAWQLSSGDLPSTIRAIVDSAYAVDDRRLSVALPDGDAKVLADPRLAVVLGAPGSDRVYGTGRYRFVPIDDSVIVVPVDSALPALRVIEMAAGADLRDVLDRDTDLVFSDDPSVARYASTRPDLSVIALPHRRTYVLVVPGSSDSTASHTSALREDVRSSLARDVVRVPAKPSQEPGWWQEARCVPSASPRQAATANRSSTIAYRADDPVARAIAERLVALSSRPGGSPIEGLLPTDGAGEPVTAEPMPADRFERALRIGSRAAFVLPIPSRPLARCQALDDFASAVPWALHEGRVRAGVMIPLIDAGAWVIVRRGAVGLAVDWDGTPRLIFSRRAAAEDST